MQASRSWQRAPREGLPAAWGWGWGQRQHRTLGRCGRGHLSAAASMGQWPPLSCTRRTGVRGLCHLWTKVCLFIFPTGRRSRVQSPPSFLFPSLRQRFLAGPTGTGAWGLTTGHLPASPLSLCLEAEGQLGRSRAGALGAAWRAGGPPCRQAGKVVQMAQGREMKGHWEKTRGRKGKGKHLHLESCCRLELESQPRPLILVTPRLLLRTLSSPRLQSR
jgi:hypothetical protein